jgi:hypothetical protein
VLALPGDEGGPCIAQRMEYDSAVSEDTPLGKAIYDDDEQEPRCGEFQKNKDKQRGGIADLRVPQASPRRIQRLGVPNHVKGTR